MSHRKSVAAYLLGSFILLFFIAIRAIHLDADFPYELTTTSVVYQDEGWYCNGAISYFLTGHWYNPGDLNIAVNMPIGHIINAVMFHIFGMNIITVRITIIIFFSILITSLYLIAKKEFNDALAIVATFLIGINFYYFAYSRLAIMEIPIISLITLSMLLSLSFNDTHRYYAYAASIVLMVIATLTKNSAAVVIPALAYLNASRETTFKRRCAVAALTLIICSSLILVYNALASHYHPDDFAYFKHLNFDARTNYSNILNYLPVNITMAMVLDIIINPICLVATFILLFTSKSFRNNKIALASIIWFICHMLSISTMGNNPTRYFLPAVIPMVLLFCAIIKTIFDSWNKKLTLGITVAIVGLSIMLNGIRTFTYLTNPKYTFIEMGQNIKKILDRESGGNRKDVLIIGNMSHSIALMTGYRGITYHAPGNLDDRIHKFHPAFCLTMGMVDRTVYDVSQVVKMQKIADFDAFNNYYQGRKTTLFRLIYP